MRKYNIIPVLLILAVLLLSACGTASQPEVILASPASLPPPEFSVPAGFYDEPFDLTLSAPEGYIIRYTLDGSVPDTSSPVYEQPIHIYNRSSDDNDISTITGISTTWDYVPSVKISKGTVVRAALFSDDGTYGETATSTYFVGLDYGDTLVVSISTDRDGLFSYENGIFMLGKHFDLWKQEVGVLFSSYGDWEYQGNFSQKGDEWEREISIEFFEDGSIAHSQIAGMRVAGAATRTYRQKSLRITARADYGSKYFEYPLIPENFKDGFSDEDVSKYRSFVLRNGGNDFDYARIRDPFIQSSVADCSLSTQQTRPAVVFINGEYWGVYTLTEDYNERYIEENFGVDKDNVAIIKKGYLEEGNEGDLELFESVYNFITTNDMRLSDAYSAACEMLDMEGFAQYSALHIYIGSQDGPFENNNWRMWRAVKTSDTPYEDGKIRIMLYDTEFSLGLYDNGRTFDENTFDHLNNNYSFCGAMFNSLMNNQQFRDMFIDEFLKMRNDRFSPENSEIRLNELFNDYKDIIDEHYIRFGSTSMSVFNSEEQFMGKINHIQRYIDGRYTAAPQLLCEYLGLDPETAIVTAPDGSVSLVY